MDSAHNIEGKWVKAENALPGVSYFCPVCRDRLSLIKDSVHKRDHFRHHPDSTCTFGAEETSEHAVKKYSIFADLRSAIGEGNVSMEYRLPDGQRPDVYFEVNGQGVAVEVQHSQIGDVELWDRTASYSDKGVAALWMPDQIKKHLNSIQVWDTSGLAKLPLWMRRIARLTDDVAFDQYSDEGASATDVLSIKLKLERRTAKNARGEWVNELYWPMQRCKLQRGVVRNDTDDRGHRLMLWLPSPVEGTGLVSTRPVRRQMRREIVEDTAGFVDCKRMPVASPEEIQALSVMLTSPTNQFHLDTLNFWLEHDKFTLAQKLIMWGFK